MTQERKPQLGPELFYDDGAGGRADADLHSEMLDGISKEGEARLIKATTDRAKKYGLSPEEIGALYGKPETYARGGATKATKERANYRLGTRAEHCGICSMFVFPKSCTAVQGKIRSRDICDYFEKKVRK